MMPDGVAGHDSGPGRPAQGQSEGPWAQGPGCSKVQASSSVTGCSEHPTRLKTRRHHFSLFSEVTDTGSGLEVSELSLLKSSLCTTVTSLKVTESLVLVKPYRWRPCGVTWDIVPEQSM